MSAHISAGNTTQWSMEDTTHQRQQRARWHGSHTQVIIMYPATIKRISIDDIGHNTLIKRFSTIDGTSYTSIVKDGIEVAICRSEDEAEMIQWWQSEGWMIWRDGRKKRDKSGER